MQHLGDAAVELEDISEDLPEDDPGERGGVWRSRLALAVLAFAAIGLALWGWSRSDVSEPRGVVRFGVEIDSGLRLGPTALTLSPDSSSLVYSAEDAVESSRLYRRPFDRFEVTPLPGTEGATAPFFSPDGTRIAFFDDEALYWVPVIGGARARICDARGTGKSGVWLDDDSIVYVLPGSGLRRVSSRGGASSTVTMVEPGELDHIDPVVAPTGHAVLFTVVTESRPAGTKIDAVRLDSGERQLVIRDAMKPRALPTGHLVYTAAGALMLARLDWDQLRIVDEPVSVLDNVLSNATGAFFDVSASGSLVYATESEERRRVLWVDRQGQATPLLSEELLAARYPRLSPDGESLALVVGPETGGAVARAGNVWVYPLSGRPPIKLTFEGNDFSPLWSPDGSRIVFERAGRMMSVASDGSGGEPEPVLTEQGHFHAQTFTPDARELIYTELGGDIFALPMTADSEARALVATPHNEGYWGTAISPDGRWLAYVSDVTGRGEIWVRPYQTEGPALRLSADGGIDPVWARDGSELYFRNGRKMMAANVVSADEIRFDPPRALFEADFWQGGQPPSYDIAPDGRFVMLESADPSAAERFRVNVVLGWADELVR